MNRLWQVDLANVIVIVVVVEIVVVVMAVIGGILLGLILGGASAAGDVYQRPSSVPPSVRSSVRP